MTKQPTNYTTEYLDAILNKDVKISIEDADSDDDEVFSFKGKIVSYNPSVDDTNLLAGFYFHTDHGAIKHFAISLLKDIRVL